MHTYTHTHSHTHKHKSWPTQSATCFHDQYIFLNKFDCGYNVMYFFNSKFKILSVSFHWQTDSLFSFGYTYSLLPFSFLQNKSKLEFFDVFLSIYIDVNILQKPINSFQELVNVINYSFKYFLLKPSAAQLRRSNDQKIGRH